MSAPLKAIRAKCLDCSAGQPREVRLCPLERCALWPYRMGKNPLRQKRELTAEAKVKLVARLAAGRAARPENEEQSVAAGGPVGGGCHGGPKAA